KEKERVPVDMSLLNTFTGGDKETEKEFVQVFVEQSDKNIKSLEASRAEGRGQEWKEAAHMFKGGAAGIGAELLRNLCEKGQHLDFSATAERKVLFDAILSEYEKVKQYFRDNNLMS